MIEGILIGLGTALTPINILFVLTGCLVGTFIGMLPGLGPMSAIALMIPVAASLEPATGIILMAAVYYGAIFGGSTSSILINAPGVASTVATSFDGYPMARQGKAGKALAIAAYSSFSGGVIAAIFLLLAAPSLAAVSLSFHSSDYFALMVLGLTAVAAFAGKGDMLKALLMTVIGLMLSTVGTDQTQGVPRFTLGLIDLTDGISFLLLVMATFALSEALIAILKPSSDGKRDEERRASANLGSMAVSKDEVKEMVPVIGRSSVLGFIIGVLPGAGATIASFLAYGTEQRLAGSEKGKQFGQGSVRGLSAPETANNAAATGSFVPLLTLGIPGSGTTAIMLGALIGYGIQPGPRLYIDQPDVFWSVIVSMSDRQHRAVDPEFAADPLYRKDSGHSGALPAAAYPVFLADRRLFCQLQYIRHPVDGIVRARRSCAAFPRFPDGADDPRLHPGWDDGGKSAPRIADQQ